MWIRMLELIWSPVALLLLTYNSYDSENVGLRSNSKFNNVRQCAISNNSKGLLFYDHPNPLKRGCYEEGSQGPCGENMELYSTNETRNGECDCKTVKSARFLLYHDETNRCYWIFEQGYCNVGEQLVPAPENPALPICQRTVCSQVLENPDNRGKDFVPYKNNTDLECVEVGSPCRNGGIIRFERDMIALRVSCSTKNKGRAMTPPHVKCSPGTYRAISGHCQPPLFSFDW